MEPEMAVSPKMPEYPTVHFDGNIFSKMGQMGDEVTIVVKGKIVSTREDKYGCCIGVEVHSAGNSTEDLKSAKLVNEADASLEKLEGHGY